jgi:hypothetical protein
VIAAQSGDHLRAIRQQARRRKDTATVAMLATTEVDDDEERELALYVNLFLMCEADRKEPFMPIPLSVMLVCITHFELDDYQADFLLSAFAIADPIVLSDRKTKYGNSSATVDTNAGSSGKSPRNR